MPMSYSRPSATDDLVFDFEVRRPRLRADQAECLMAHALRQGRIKGACRYHRYASAACIALIDLLTA